MHLTVANSFGNIRNLKAADEIFETLTWNNKTKLTYLLTYLLTYSMEQSPS